jgi:GAF domain-containing protein
MPIDPDDLTVSLRRLEQTGADSDVLAALDAALAACLEIFDVDGCGLMVADEHQILRHVASTDTPGHILEEIEATYGEGPCTDCFVLDTVVDTDDVAVDPRWPNTGVAVGPLGVHAVLGVPIRVGGVPLGTLDVYRRRPHRWDDTEVRAIRRYGEVVELILSSALAAERAGELTEQLQYALDHRLVIERAVGFLMGRDRLDAVAAFNALRRDARSQRRKVGDIAQRLLDGA